ncbi:MAG: hypothetical protein AAF402_05780 [Pseudomonadota bacterium]
MTHSDTLIALSQLSVALAGFSGIIVALRQRSLTSWPEHELVRFRYMLELAVYSIGFDLLPLLVNALGFDALFSWQFCSILLSVWLVIRIFQTATIQKTIRDRLSLVWFYIYQLGSGAVILALAANAMGLSTFSAYGIYLFGLAWLLFFSLSLFVRLTISPISTQDQGITDRSKTAND